MSSLRFLLILTTSALPFALVACDKGCDHDTECPTSQICVESACIPIGVDGGSDADGDVETDVETDVSVDTTNPRCELASVEFVTPGATHAVVGGLFAETPYMEATFERHTPAPVQVVVSDDNGPITGCPVSWTAEGASVFPEGDSTTNADGVASAWWVASDVLAPTLTASVSPSSSANLAGTVLAADRMRLATVGLDYDTPIETVDGASVTVNLSDVSDGATIVPLEWPTGRVLLQFSETSQVWCGDAFAPDCAGCETCGGDCAPSGAECTPGRIALVPTYVHFIVDQASIEGSDGIVDPGQTNYQEMRTAESAATQLRFPPVAHGAIAGLPDSYTLSESGAYQISISVSPGCGGSCSQITALFTDVELGVTVSLGTLSQAEVFTPILASSISDPSSKAGQTCTNSGMIAAHFSGAEVTFGDAMAPLTSALVSSEYADSPFAFCANYEYRTDAGYLLRSGGIENLTAPLEALGARPRLTLP